MKKVLFSALAVVAVGAAVMGGKAYSTYNDDMSELFLGGVEQIAQAEDNGKYINYDADCILTLDGQYNPMTGKYEPGEQSNEKKYWCTTGGYDEICDEFCNCDDC